MSRHARQVFLDTVTDSFATRWEGGSLGFDPHEDGSLEDDSPEDDSHEDDSPEDDSSEGDSPARGSTKRVIVLDDACSPVHFNPDRVI